MRVLRDVREVTKLLILLEITRRQQTSLKPLAERFDLSIQMVSDYMKAMRREGLVNRVGGVYRATKKGVDLLHRRFTEIKEFVDSSMEDLKIIDVASAVAGEDLKAGVDVGLVMEHGRLVAYPHREASSRGRALYDAGKGEDVAVTDLEGIVELRPGRVMVVRLPWARAGGSRDIDPGEAKARLGAFRPDLVAVTDPVALAFAGKASWPVDLEFSPAGASIDAALRGLHVLILTTSPHFEQVIKEIEGTNTWLEDSIPYSVLNFGRDYRSKRKG